jgi:hypothetical protein
VADRDRCRGCFIAAPQPADVNGKLAKVSYLHREFSRQYPENTVGVQVLSSA